MIQRRSPALVPKVDFGPRAAQREGVSDHEAEAANQELADADAAQTLRPRLCVLSQSLRRAREQESRVKEGIRISAESARRLILDVAIFKPAVLRTAVRTSLKRSGLA